MFRPRPKNIHVPICSSSPSLQVTGIDKKLFFYNDTIIGFADFLRNQGKSSVYILLIVLAEFIKW